MPNKYSDRDLAIQLEGALDSIAKDKRAILELRQSIAGETMTMIMDLFDNGRIDCIRVDMPKVRNLITGTLYNE